MKNLRKGMRYLAMFLAVNILTQLCIPTISWALTSGPSQPEVQSFSPVGTDNFVDPFTGDFNYSIPIFDVGGYPVNLTYNAGITTDQEASWVGLGWNLSCGSINRSMRSVPDDFQGDQITRKFNLKDNHTFGVKPSINSELFGLGFLSGGIAASLSYNNYNGFGFDFSPNLGVQAGVGSKGSLNAGLGLTLSSETGTTVSPSLGFSTKAKQSNTLSQSLGGRLGLSYNSREGLKQVSFGYDYSISQNKSKATTGATGTIFSSYPTHVPKIEFPMSNINANVGINLGTSFWGADVMGGLGAFYAGQNLMFRSTTLPSYGYMNTHLANGNDYAMLDFNREKDGSFTENTPNLPLTNYTYDIYSVTGHGIGGTFRAYRNDLSSIYDVKTFSVGGGGSLDNIEFGAAAGMHIGGNVSFNTSTSQSGRWEQASGISGYKPSQQGKSYEPYHFRMVGEKSMDPNYTRFTNGFGSNIPVMPALLQDEPSSVLNTDQLLGTNATLQKSRGDNDRMTRNDHIKAISEGDRALKAITKSIVSYTEGTFTLNSDNQYIGAELQNSDRTIIPHHVGEFLVTKTDGARYVYGIPVYNNFQDEVTYATNSQSADINGLVPYSSNEDTENNSAGLDNYYNKTSMPPYTTAHLLNYVLSHDFVDVDGDGPSDRDLGNYTKINYTRKYRNFQWRNPTTPGKCQFNEGLFNNSLDNKANYLHGSKEIYYVHSIESKTMVADFYTSPRKDGFGVTGANSALDYGQPMMQLDKIVLYSKAEKVANPSNPIPIKTVHFEYGNSLCPNVTNSQNSVGKLTLNKVYFTYGRSSKGILNPYEFDYGTVNKGYGQKNTDRWGYFKDNNRALANDIFPFVEQNKAVADENAAMWALKKIKTPNAATIEVTYESDDYAYVQNRKAMQMFRIAGIGSPGSFNNLYNNNSIYIDITGAGLNTNTILKLKGDIQQMYFKAFLDIKGSKNDYVNGYANILTSPTDPGISYQVIGTQEYAVIKVEKPAGDVHPIAKAGFLFARQQAPKLIQGRDIEGRNSPLEMGKAIISAFGSLLELFQGADNFCKTNHVAEQFASGNIGWVRLQNPNGKKLGGGHRVAAVKMHDNFEVMNSSNLPAYYGQEYNYETTDSDGSIISSGVAAYEPANGNEENPFRQPVFYDKEKILAPSDQYFVEEPFGESFFPSPTVGYSKVTVKNIARTNVKRSATGYTVSEFFTAKDYPTITKQTQVDPKRYKPSPILEILKLESLDNVCARQGFYIETNDMHGKPKSSSVYNEGDAKISGMRYFYKEKSDVTHYNANGNSRDLPITALNNEVTTLFQDGTIDTKALGVEYEIINDSRESSTSTITGGANGNLETIIWPFPPAPIIIPIILPTYNREETRFRSDVITKVVQRFGIQTKTEAFEDGATVHTTNLAWDPQTGDVLLTEITNQYSDKTYNLNLPAYWAYEGMGQAFVNDGFEFKSGDLSKLVPGDEVFLGTTKSWYLGGSKFIDKDGGNVSSTDGVVVRSGRRNMTGMSVGSYTFTKNPIDGITKLNLSGIAASSEILNASATEFASSWKVHCECGFDPATTPTYNAYVKGLAGIYRPSKTYHFLTQRTQTRFNNNTNIRKDGVYTAFSPFWLSPGTNDFIQPSPAAWQYTSQITEYNPIGMELEALDAIGRYSTNLYGYNYTLPIATSTNSQYHESAFDGFEDYSYSGCANQHLRYGDFKDQVKRDQSHTGRYSMKILPGGEVKVTKVIKPCQAVVPEVIVK